MASIFGGRDVTDAYEDVQAEFWACVSEDCPIQDSVFLQDEELCSSGCPRYREQQELIEEYGEKLLPAHENALIVYEIASPLVDG